MHNALACSITVRVKPKNKHLSTEGILRTSVVTTTRGGNSRNKKPINAEDIAQSIGLSSLSTSQNTNNEIGFESTECGTLRYEFRPAGVLRRLHYPRYLQLIENLYGNDATVLLGTLLYHGIWKKKPCLIHAAYNIENNCIIGPGNYKNNLHVDLNQLPASITTIINKRLLPLWDILINQGFIIQHEGLPAPFPSDLLASPISYNSSSQRKKIVEPTPTAGRKRARKEVVDSDDELEKTIDNQVLWRFGWETVTRYLRNDIIIRYVRSAAVRGNESQIVSAVHVVRACLELTVNNENGFLDLQSSPVTASSILEKIVQNTSDNTTINSTISMNNAVKLTRTNNNTTTTTSTASTTTTDEPWTLDRVLKLLQQLSTLPTPIVQEVPNYTGKAQNRAFMLNYAILISAIQLRTIENIALERYDEQGARILRMLLEKGMLDEKLIAERALLEPKATRAIIFQMVGDGLITTQELPRRPDRQPQYTFYMFHANMDRILVLLSDYICKNILNLRIRFRLELSRLETLRNKLITLNTTLNLEKATTENNNTTTISSSSSTTSTIKTDITNMESMMHHIEEGIHKLEIAIIRVDETLLLLSEL